MRAIPALFVIALLVAVTVFVADRPGDVSILWQGWRVETSVAVLLLAVLVVSLIVAVVLAILRALFGGPRAFLRRRRDRRRAAGYRALTQGMVAVAAGDPEEAQRYARKADALLAEPPLTLLLSAQAAQLNGDEDAARKYFTAMLNRPETEFLGLRGLLTQALRADDRTTALRLAERARALQPRTPWVLASLFDLQARRGSWKEALETLSEASRRKAIPAPEARRHQAALRLELSREAELAGRTKEALGEAEKAVSVAPGFAPAVRRAAGLLARDGRARQAIRLVEAAWRLEPHPALAELYAGFFPGEGALQRMKRLERLADVNPEAAESHLMLATAAIDAQLWGEARRHLERAGSSRPEPRARICRLMARLEEADRGDTGAARAWLSRAAEGQADPTWHCDACAAESRDWSALCPSCGAFDTLSWRSASRPLPALPAAVKTEALPAPPAETAADKPVLVGTN